MKKPPKGIAARRRHAAAVVARLAELYPDAQCSLNHANPFELLVATILSAQCTDARVNLVTPAVFRRYPTPEALALAPRADVEKLIQSTGFFRNKAKNLIACAQALVAEHGGQVPATLKALVPLPGVGRKTANVVLGNAFGVPGMVVDTHVKRLSRRLGLAEGNTPEKIEQELMATVPPAEWVQLSHRLIEHGRKVCKAQRPACEGCPLANLCPRVGV